MVPCPHHTAAIPEIVHFPLARVTINSFCRQPIYSLLTSPSDRGSITTVGARYVFNWAKTAFILALILQQTRWGGFDRPPMPIKGAPSIIAPPINTLKKIEPPIRAFRKIAPPGPGELGWARTSGNGKLNSFRGFCKNTAASSPHARLFCC